MKKNSIIIFLLHAINYGGNSLQRFLESPSEQEARDHFPQEHQEIEPMPSPSEFKKACFLSFHCCYFLPCNTYGERWDQEEVLTIQRSTDFCFALLRLPCS